MGKIGQVSVEVVVFLYFEGEIMRVNSKGRVLYSFVICVYEFYKK